MFNGIKKWLGYIGRSKGIVWTGTDEEWATIIGGNEQPSGVRVNTKSVMGIPGFKRAVDLIANKIAVCELNTFKRKPTGGREFAREHPVFKLLKVSPGPNLTPFDLKKQQIADVLYSGNSYTYITRAGAVPQELAILDPDAMIPTVVYDGTKSSVVYVYNTHEGMIPLDPENVIHLKGLSFGNAGLVGNSLLEYCGEALGLSLSVQRYASVFFKSGGLSGAWVEVPEGGFLDEEKEKQLLEALKRLYGGIENVHSPIVLQGGAKLNKSNLSMEQSQALSARGYSLTDIANIVGIDQTFIGGDAKAQGYGSLQAAKEGLLGDTFLPFLVQSEQQHNRKLLRTDEWDTYYIEYDRTDLERGDKATEQAVLQARFFAGEISWQEMREEQNRPTEVGDDETFYLPSNLVRFDPTAPIEPPAPPAPPPGSNGNPPPNLTEIKPNQPANQEPDTKSVARSSLARLIRRVQTTYAKNQQTNLVERHSRVFAESLPGIPTTEWLQDLEDELAAVLPEQRAEIFNKLGDKWTI